MKFTKEQQKEAYEKLSDEIRSFIIDNETTDLINKFLAEINLDEDISNLADSEIWYSLIGLQNLNDTIKGIESIYNNQEDLEKLKTKLDESIFSEIKEIEKKQPKKERQNNVGNDFQRMVGDRVRAMRPAVVPNSGEVDIKTNTERQIHDYKTGNDPYREPIE